MSAKLSPCETCSGQGFKVERCGCREALCPHTGIGEPPEAPRPGMYQKFWVTRTDGSSIKGGKHAACDYFVIDWRHDRYAAAAALAYADACEGDLPELARDLRSRAAAQQPKETP